jgi:26S proteasome regulatory subunit T1
LEGRAHIFKIHAQRMNVAPGIRYELLARLCPNSTGADIRSVCTEAGMYAIRSRRKVCFFTSLLMECIELVGLVSNHLPRSLHPADRY